MTDRVDRYLFHFETLGPGQVVAAMQQLGVESKQLEEVWRSTTAAGAEQWRQMERVTTKSGDTVTRYWDQQGKLLREVEVTSGQTAQGIKKLTTVVRESGEAVDQSTSKWMRHLLWIGQGILIWEGIGIIKRVIGDWITVQKELDTELIRFHIAMGDSNEVAQEYLDTVMAISREMRMPPGQIAGAVGIAYRVGEEDIAEYAAGIARLTGGDATKILRELIALHRQFPEQRMIDLMDEWISAWQRSTLTAGEFFGMLETSGGLVKFFNTDLNTLLNLFVHITTVAGEAGGSVERFVRMFTKFYEPGHKLREATEQFIGPTVMFDPTTGAEVRRPIEDIIQAIAELNEAQQQIISNNFPSLMGQSYGPWFLQVVKGFEATTAEAGAFDDAMSTMSDSFIDKARGMESAWDRFLAKLGDTETIKASMDLITGTLEALEDLMGAGAQLDPATIMRGIIMGGYGAGRDWAEQWGAQAPVVGRGRGTMPGGRPRVGPAAAPTLPGLPGEAGMLPVGVDFNKLQAASDFLSDEIQRSAASAGYFVAAQKNTVTVTDQFGVVLGTVTLGLADFGTVIEFVEQAFAELPRSFAQMTQAEWALTQQVYPYYRDRYQQYDIDPGEMGKLIGPGGDPFTAAAEPWADATRHSTTLLRAEAQARQELIRWQERSTAAYKKGVAAWEGMVMGLPGVSGPTAVTAYDMGLTGVGLYQDKWDEPVRRMRQNIEDLIAGRGMEYPAEMAQPWAQEIFAPIMGAGPEALRGGMGMYEQRHYGLQFPWEAYAPQMGILADEVRAFQQREERSKVIKGKITEGLIAEGLGPEEVGDWFEYEEMSPMAKWASGGKMPSELKDELEALGGIGAEGITGGMLGEFEDNPWVDKVIGAWKTEVSTDENVALFVGVGELMGSRMQDGLVISISDRIFPKIVAYIIKMLKEDEGL